MKRSSQAPLETRSSLLPRLAAAAPLIQPPNTVTLYSDLGFMLLQAVVETASGLPLDRFCTEENLPSPAPECSGKNSTPCQREVLTQKTENRKQKKLQLYAFTEPGLIPGRNLCGEVHDENAWAAGGVAGHAGLFGPGPEVFALLAALYRAYRGKTTLPFSTATVRRFLTPAAPGARALGFDVPSANASLGLGGALLFSSKRRSFGLHRHLFLAGPGTGPDGSLAHQPGALRPGRRSG